MFVTKKEKIIAKQLMALGISPHYVGYRYLLAALEYTIDDNSLLNQITTSLYPAVAAMYGTTTSNVERCIRTVIENNWRTGNKEMLHRLFGNRQKQRPSNAQFIAIMTQHLTFLIED